jgi:hypothetical protein
LISTGDSSVFGLSVVSCWSENTEGNALDDEPEKTVCRLSELSSWIAG